MIACGLASFCSLASLKIIPLVALGAMARFFHKFTSRIEKMFEPPQSDGRFLFEGFFQKSLYLSLSLSSHSDIFFPQLFYLFSLWLFLL